MWIANKTAIADDDVLFFQDTDASPASARDGYITALDLKNYTNYPETLIYTTNASPSVADILANKFISNYGAAGTITIALPALPVRASIVMLIESAQITQFAIPSGEAIDLSGTSLNVDQLLASSTTIGSILVLTRRMGGAGALVWSADQVRGAWVGV